MAKIAELLEGVSDVIINGRGLLDFPFCANRGINVVSKYSQKSVGSENARQTALGPQEKGRWDKSCMNLQ